MGSISKRKNAIFMDRDILKEEEINSILVKKTYVQGNLVTFIKRMRTEMPSIFTRKSVVQVMHESHTLLHNSIQIYAENPVVNTGCRDLLPS